MRNKIFSHLEYMFCTFGTNIEIAWSKNLYGVEQKI
jgi:hypothetical protein